MLQPRFLNLSSQEKQQRSKKTDQEMVRSFVTDSKTVFQSTLFLFAWMDWAIGLTTLRSLTTVQLVLKMLNVGSVVVQLIPLGSLIESERRVRRLHLRSSNEDRKLEEGNDDGKCCPTKPLNYQ